jgi:hypothetical protein
MANLIFDKLEKKLATKKEEYKKKENKNTIYTIDKVSTK